MPKGKSPGPDGLPAEFFQNSWNHLGSELTNVILGFLNGGKILKEINNTFITLIPKIDNPLHVSDFRPISLCNTIYKLASKVLVNRLKPHLPSIISPYQNGFIMGRKIQDNVILAQELTHHIRLSKREKTPLVAIKVDMSKAFDRIDWEFLEQCLIKYKLPTH